MKKSTSNLGRFHGWRILNLLHSYVYLRWTSVYVRLVKYVLKHPGRFPGWLYGGAGERLMHTHHAKVISAEMVTRLIDIKEPISIKNPERVLPFKEARDIILDNPASIAVIDCPCRKVSDNPCQPIDVCLYFGEPFVDFLVEHNKGNARRLSISEALEILEREHKRGRVHTAWFKDVLGNRLYAICNCCSCCCMGFHALEHGFATIASSGYVAVVDEDVCTMCGECDGVCHFNSIHASSLVEVDQNGCKGCGVCVDFCPVGAITLIEDAGKPGPLVL